MKHRVRAVTQWLGVSSLIFLGCTKLEDPNQWFGDAGGGSGGKHASGGNAGRSGEDGGGDTNARAGTGGTSAGSGGQLSSNGSAGEAGSSSVGCEDETGFDGLGCYRCAPEDITTLENACTSASCVRFDDDRRLTLLGKDGKLPELPKPSGGE